ncbi:MBL fold metallo-hydrolase [Candidatus Methanomassiliicoccus intestinalis]|jgi:hypothetical protein|uniref:Zn-dependent hydrolase of the beta-lactamase fold-like protein n=3 Tax=Candidatus Methanomassiliicoccus intestinalis TaxID=1406512 RepID=R9T648_METII|nr:MBL fold metallo-hydrolase [Candidatus Methanomassiliicoccus intestinalis]AGN26477.1 Zn-dependent hydrolase of the beta-lactamase fold-like protein [Candidatus Methanomassiliicoccus intestinalis Issoire-Mx1]TQS81387.1 MAG: Zn-dependent hydrolase [Candidatus Methanomassiliicoccus intestinalis]TQS84235.1 MAG: Zn-dependent hydrolase [Candidatus Methanomassiliicoccus intestinalis]
MKIIWHGHSCFEIRDGITVVTDPHDGKSIGIKPPVVKADVVLVSHDHFDHNCVRIVKGDPKVVTSCGETAACGLNVRGIPTFHDNEEGSKRGKNTIFCFEMDGIRFCHCGDLGHLLTEKQAEAIGPVDILFIPVGGVFTIDSQDAKRVIELLKPSVAIPMHYHVGGLSISVAGIDPFLDGLPEEDILGVGNEIDFNKEDMSPKTEYWVFSP